MNFKLQPYSGLQSRYACPQCNHRSKTFVRYIDAQTGQQLAAHVGRCNREDQCGYHFKPGQYFRDDRRTNPSGFTPGNSYRKAPCVAAVNLQPDYISAQLVNKSFTAYNNNNFVRYLEARFGFAIANELVGRYRIGTSRHWPGATVFWQLDTDGQVRTGKVMLYNCETGKRVRQPYNHITWAHKIINKTEAQGRPPKTFNLKQCLFGEHLLATDPYKPVAIVESEKTAIIASVVIPKFVWLASGSLEGLSVNKCKILQGRQVMLFPDVNAYDKWKLKALQLQMAMPGTIFLVSSVLENIATEQDRKVGIDIGDLVGW